MCEDELVGEVLGEVKIVTIISGLCEYDIKDGDRTGVKKCNCVLYYKNQKQRRKVGIYH